MYFSLINKQTSRFCASHERGSVTEQVPSFFVDTGTFWHLIPGSWGFGDKSTKPLLHLHSGIWRLSLKHSAAGSHLLRSNVSHGSKETKLKVWNIILQTYLLLVLIQIPRWNELNGTSTKFCLKLMILVPRFHKKNNIVGNENHIVPFEFPHMKGNCRETVVVEDLEKNANQSWDISKWFSINVRVKSRGRKIFLLFATAICAFVISLDEHYVTC